MGAIGMQNAPNPKLGFTQFGEVGTSDGYLDGPEGFVTVNQLASVSDACQ
jgi:hypothetical protein